MPIQIIFLFYKEAINPEADELHKENEEIEGNGSEEGATKPQEDQIVAEICQNIRTSV